MNFNEYYLEKWPLSKIWELKNTKKLIKPEWQRELKLEPGYQDRFVISAFAGDLNQNWILADLKTCDGFDEELNNGKEYTYEDCQHRLAALENIMLKNYFKDGDMLKSFLSIKVPVYIVINKTKEELSKKFGRVNSGKTVSNDHILFIEPTVFNKRIKSELITPTIIKSIYGFKNKSGSNEKKFYGNVIKMIKVCSFHEGLTDNPRTIFTYLLKFLSNFPDDSIFDGMFDIFLNEWFDIVKCSDKKNEMWKQSSWFFILHINKHKNINYNLEQLHKVYDRFVTTRHVNPKTGTDMSIARIHSDQRYELLLKVFEYEV